jgi:hypothetical protein
MKFTVAQDGIASMQPLGMATSKNLWQRRGLLTLGPYGDGIN